MSEFQDVHENDQEDDVDVDDLVEVLDDESTGVGGIESEDENEEDVGAAVMEEENEIENIAPIDDAYAVFNGHSDSVYCAAIHPTHVPRLILTGV